MKTFKMCMATYSSDEPEEKVCDRLRDAHALNLKIIGPVDCICADNENAAILAYSEKHWDELRQLDGDGCCFAHIIEVR